MPTYLITGPDGTKYKVSGPGTKEEALAQVQAKVTAQSQPTAEPAQEPVQQPAAPTVGMGEDILRSAGSGLRSGVEGMAGMMGDAAQMQGDIAGWAAEKFGASPETQMLFRKGGRALSPGGFLPSTPEIQAGTNAVVGEGYKPQTMPGEYARTIGQFAPNMVSPGTLARKTAATVIPALASETAGQLTKGTAAEPYARGAGALVGGVATMGRNVKGPKPVAAPAAKEMADEGSALYTKMRESGVVIKPEKITRLKTNIDLTLGGTTETLAPTAYGLKELADKTLSATPGIEELHNFAKAVNRASRQVKPGGEDAEFVGRIKTQIQHMRNNMTADDITGGGPEAFQLWKQADELWTKQKKSQTIEKIMDMADVDGAGKYTQSGFANAVTREMKKLYKAIQSGKEKNWSPEEVRLIRQMARGGSNSRLINLMAKFDPKGVVSIIGGQAAGSLVPGVGNIALPLLGHAAGRAADKGALAAAERIRSGAATGSIGAQFPALPKDPNAIIRLLMNANSTDKSVRENTGVR